jgi:hypothetical protein
MAAWNRLRILLVTTWVDDSTLAMGSSTGRNGLVEHVQRFHGFLGDRKIEIKRKVANEDEVMGLWTAEGIHVRDWAGVPCDWRPYEWPRL